MNGSDEEGSWGRGQRLPYPILRLKPRNKQGLRGATPVLQWRGAYERRRYKEIMIRKQYPVGETLFAEGEPSDYACRILSGEVDIVKQNERETVSLGTAKAGEFVGELGVIQGSPRSATVRALSPVTVEVVSKEEFLKRIRRTASCPSNCLAA